MDPTKSPFKKVLCKPILNSLCVKGVSEIYCAFVPVYMFEEKI